MIGPESKSLKVKGHVFVVKLSGKGGSNGCVRPMVNCAAWPKQEEESEEAEKEEQKGGEIVCT